MMNSVLFKAVNILKMSKCYWIQWVSTIVQEQIILSYDDNDDKRILVIYAGMDT